MEYEWGGAGSYEIHKNILTTNCNIIYRVPVGNFLSLQIQKLFYQNIYIISGDENQKGLDTTPKIQLKYSTS